MMRMCGSSAILAGVLIGACGAGTPTREVSSGEQPSRPPSTTSTSEDHRTNDRPAEPAPAPSCESRVAWIREQVASAQPLLVHLRFEVPLPTVAFKPRRITRDEPWLTVARDGWTYNHTPFDRADARKTLLDSARFWREQGEESTPIYVAAAPDVDLATLREILDMLPPSLTPRLVVGQEAMFEEEVPEYARSWWRRFRQLPPSERAQAVVDATARWMGQECEPVREAARQVAESDVGLKWRLGQEVFPEALLECDCAGVDRRFDWMLSTLIVPPFQGVGWTDLPRPLPKSGVVADLVAGAGG